MLSYHDSKNLWDIQVLLSEITYSLKRIETFLLSEEEGSEREKKKEELVEDLRHTSSKKESQYDFDEYESCH